MIVGRCLVAAVAVARAIAFVAAVADVPMSLMAVLVSARASVPVWSDDGDEPKRAMGSYSCAGGKTLRFWGIDGWRLSWFRAVEECWRDTAGMANGGVVDKPNGGEYDMGTTTFFVGCGAVVADGDVAAEAGLNDETGRVTTLGRELGRRVNAVECGFLEAWSTSASSAS